MTSGIPLSDDEQRYILRHMNDGPARIAFDLGREFSSINGGFRKRDTVKKFIKRIRAGVPVVVEIPPELAKIALDKGVLPEQLRFVALRAVLQYLK